MQKYQLNLIVRERCKDGRFKHAHEVRRAPPIVTDHISLSPAANGVANAAITLSAPAGHLLDVLL